MNHFPWRRPNEQQWTFLICLLSTTRMLEKHIQIKDIIFKRKKHGYGSHVYKYHDIYEKILYMTLKTATKNYLAYLPLLN